MKPFKVDDFYAELGRRIAAARKSHDLTQGELADIVQLTRTSVTNIEKGRQKVLAHTVLGFATALGMNISQLLPEPARNSQVDRVAPALRSSILRAVPELDKGQSS